jgi:hypothetical protein
MNPPLIMKMLSKPPAFRREPLLNNYQVSAVSWASRMFQEPMETLKLVNVADTDLPSLEFVYIFMIKMDTRSPDKTTFHIPPVIISKQLKQQSSEY